MRREVVGSVASKGEVGLLFGEESLMKGLKRLIILKIEEEV